MFRVVERARDREELRTIIEGSETEETAIDIIAAENGVPRFIAKQVYRKVVRQLKGAQEMPGKSQSD